jgi:glycosyltransferase involved in cell wall biosynthesis
MKQIVERLDHESYAQIKHFFSFSEYVRDNLIKAYGIDPNKITVVGAGRGSLQPFTEEKDYRNGHILFVAKGRFEDKGGLILLEAFKIAQRKNPHLKLIIVGQDEYTHLNGSIPNLTVKGYIPWGEELQNLFNTASLFAMPALNEPWGLVYLEALATKTPILGLNRNALPEITRDGQYGFLVNEPTPERVADAILQAFSNPENLSKMGVRGQKYCVEKFSWNQVATKIAKLMLDS